MIAEEPSPSTELDPRGASGVSHRSRLSQSPEDAGDSARVRAGGRRILLAGFGGLLLLMLVAGVDALMVLREVRTKDAQERNLYLRRATALDRVRTGIYQSAIAMRAYLLANSTRDAA